MNIITPNFPKMVNDNWRLWKLKNNLKNIKDGGNVTYLLKINICLVPAIKSFLVEVTRWNLAGEHTTEGEVKWMNIFFKNLKDGGQIWKKLFFWILKILKSKIKKIAHSLHSVYGKESPLKISSIYNFSILRYLWHQILPPVEKMDQKGKKGRKPWKNK